MIETIKISEVATYDNTPQVLSGLAKVNFLYGANGSGKTTITRIIANDANYPTCGLTWKGGTKLQTVVYNRDFVERNFNQAADLKGIFTLGEKNVETLAKITTAKQAHDALNNTIEVLSLALNGLEGVGGKRAELAGVEDDFKNKCWTQKQKHDAKFSAAFEGYRNSSEKFKTKLSQERKTNKGQLETLSILQARAETVFGPTPTVEQKCPVVDVTKLIGYQADSILKKRIIGNPIKTSYELLWHEVKRKDRSNLTIQNTLRRILEYYFRILGGTDPDQTCNLFEGKEKIICKSLFSWVNDGSHFAHDDVFISVDDSGAEIYLKVFKDIFEKSKHIAHYDMMMREDGHEKAMAAITS